MRTTKCTKRASLSARNDEGRERKESEQKERADSRRQEAEDPRTSYRAFSSGGRCASRDRRANPSGDGRDLPSSGRLHLGAHGPSRSGFVFLLLPQGTICICVRASASSAVAFFASSRPGGFFCAKDDGKVRAVKFRDACSAVIARRSGLVASKCSTWERTLPPCRCASPPYYPPPSSYSAQATAVLSVRCSRLLPHKRRTSGAGPILPPPPRRAPPDVLEARGGEQRVPGVPPAALSCPRPSMPRRLATNFRQCTGVRPKSRASPVVAFVFAVVALPRLAAYAMHRAFSISSVKMSWNMRRVRA